MNKLLEGFPGEWEEIDNSNLVNAKKFYSFHLTLLSEINAFKHFH
jgi:hypothetical protein